MSSIASRSWKPMIFMTDRIVEPTWRSTASVRPVSSPSPIQRNHGESDVDGTSGSVTRP